MIVSYPVVTVVEHEGRRWIVDLQGSVVRGLEFDVGVCPEDVAIQGVSDVLASEERGDAFRREQKLEFAWRQLMWGLPNVIHGILRAGVIARGEDWDRCINSSACSCRQKVRRGSNIRPRNRSNPPTDWEQSIRRAASIPAQHMYWYRDEWAPYFRDRASNLRKRFRLFSARESSSPASGRSENGVCSAEDPQGPRAPVLLDGRRTDAADGCA